MPKTKVKVKSTECIHHWVLDAPAGPVSKGRCKLCGRTGEFVNSMGHRITWWDSPRVRKDRESWKAKKRAKSAV